MHRIYPPDVFSLPRTWSLELTLSGSNEDTNNDKLMVKKVMTMTTTVTNRIAEIDDKNINIKIGSMKA